MNIIWSEDAIIDYHQNIDYLITEWSEKLAAEFIEDVEGVLELIKIQPEIYPISNYHNIRKAVIRKQISLFYEVKGQKIFLVRFWNNYQNPNNLKLE